MYKNDAKMKSKWCMGGPGELRRGNGRVKDASGAVLDQFWSFLGVDFGAKNELFFQSDFLLFFEVQLSIDFSDFWGPI